MTKLNIILLTSITMFTGLNAQSNSKPIEVKFIDSPIHSNHIFNKKTSYTYDKNDYY